MKKIFLYIIMIFALFGCEKWNLERDNPNDIHKPNNIDNNNIPLDIPSLIYPTNGSYFHPDSSIKLQWNSVLGATSYILEWSENENFEIINVTFPETISLNISDTFQLFFSQKYNTKYFWRVSAKNENITSDCSNVWTFIITNGTSWFEFSKYIVVNDDNNNDIINKGENISLDVYIKNITYSATGSGFMVDDVYVIVSTENTNILQLTPTDPIGYGTIYSEEEKSGNINFKVSNDIEIGIPIEFDILIIINYSNPEYGIVYMLNDFTIQIYE